MKKSFKRILALLVSFVMVFAMAIGVFAESTTTSDTANITIQNAQKNSTYSLYQLATWSVDESGKTNNIIINSRYSKVLTTDILSRLENKSVTLIANTENYWPVDSAYQSLATTMAATINADNIQADKTTTVSGEENTASFTDLEYGYYLIVETNTDGPVISTAPILVPVSTPNTDVYPKSSQPTVTKVIEKNDNDYSKSTEDIGDTVSYRLDAKVPKYDANATGIKFMLTDNACKGLTVDLKTVRVWGVSSSGETSLTGTDAYTLSELTEILENGEYSGGHQFTVDFTYDRIKQYDYVSVRYDATLNENCVVEEDGNPNKVKLTYTNNYTTKSEEDTDWTEVRTYTYKFSIYKKAKDTSGNFQPLSGANFVVYKKGTAETSPYGEQVKYYLDGDNSTNVQNAKNNTLKVGEETYSNVFTTGTDGYIYLTGLDVGTYIIKEIKAPDGYNLATDVVFEIIAETGTNGATEIRTDKSATGNEPTGTVTKTNTGQIDIEDTKGITLPGTGGIGTTIFTFGGLALIILAAVMFFVYTRKQKKQS